MIDKLQEAYDKLIIQSNIQYAMSTNPDKMFDGLRTQFEHGSGCYQDAAAWLASFFPEIKTKDTIREVEIREHHLEDEASQERDEPRNQVETDLP